MPEEQIDETLARELLEFLQSYNLFGEHLALNLEHSEITASQLARKIHVTPAAISQWVNGKRMPDSGIIYKIAQALQLSPNQRQSLMAAWDSTRYFQGYAAYLDEAISQKDLETVRIIFASTLNNEAEI